MGETRRLRAVPPRRRFAVLVLLAGLLVAAAPMAAQAAPASAHGAPASGGPAHGAPASGGRAAAGNPPSRSVWLADALRRNPVYVTDQLPRAVPRSMAPRFAAVAKRTGVPTYVFVLPDTDDEGSLVAEVHDRLGKPGVYVQLDEMGITEAKAFGVRAPVEAATTVVTFEEPYDSGPLRHFRTFADTLASGSARAAERAEHAREAHSSTGDDVARAYIDDGDREDQTSLMGLLLTGPPLLVLFAVPLLAPRRGPGGRQRWRWRWPAGAAAAAALAALVACGAPAVFDETTDSAAPPPTRADLTARVHRVAAGLRADPLYTDPESPQRLTTAQRARIEARLARFAHHRPVYLTVLPMVDDDESGEKAGAFLTALHRRLGRDGLYVVADIGGSIDYIRYGGGFDPDKLYRGVPDSVRFDNTDADDHRIGARLDRFTKILETVPKAAPDRSDDDGDDGDDGGGDGYDDPSTRPEPVSDHRLPSLYSNDGLAPGLIFGVLGGLVAFGLLASVVGTCRAVRRRRGGGRDGTDTAAVDAPDRAWLRRTAVRELAAALEQFERRESGADSPPTGTADPRTPGDPHRHGVKGAGDSSRGAEKRRSAAWDCLDAALLLSHGELTRKSSAGLSAAELATVIVLAQAVRQEKFKAACVANPLHGPSRAAGRGCTACSGRELRLPVEERVRPVPYTEAGGPLAAVRRGLPELIAETRGYVGVRQ